MSSLDTLLKEFSDNQAKEYEDIEEFQNTQVEDAKQ